MIRKSLVAVTALSALAMSAPAHATWGSWWGGTTHKHYPGCGHSGTTTSSTTTSSGSTTTGGYTSTTSTTTGGSTTTSTSTTTGGSTTTSTTSGGTTTTTSGGSTSTSSGGTAVPEPGMLGLMGLALLGIGAARRRKRAAA